MYINHSHRNVHGKSVQKNMLPPQPQRHDHHRLGQLRPLLRRTRKYEERPYRWLGGHVVNNWNKIVSSRKRSFAKLLFRKYVRSDFSPGNSSGGARVWSAYRVIRKEKIFQNLQNIIYHFKVEVLICSPTTRIILVSISLTESMILLLDSVSPPRLTIIDLAKFWSSFFTSLSKPHW